MEEIKFGEHKAADEPHITYFQDPKRDYDNNINNINNNNIPINIPTVGLKSESVPTLKSKLSEIDDISSKPKLQPNMQSVFKIPSLKVQYA